MYTITQEQLQQVVSYLASKPFGEVFQLINTLQALPKVEEKKEEIIKE